VASLRHPRDSWLPGLGDFGPSGVAWALELNGSGQLHDSYIPISRSELFATDLPQQQFSILARESSWTPDAGRYGRSVQEQTTTSLSAQPSWFCSWAAMLAVAQRSLSVSKRMRQLGVAPEHWIEKMTGSSVTMRCLFKGSA